MAKSSLVILAGVYPRAPTSGWINIARRLLFARLSLRQRAERRWRFGRKLGQLRGIALSGERKQSCAGRRRIRGYPRIGVFRGFGKGMEQKKKTGGSCQDHAEKPKQRHRPLIAWRFPCLCHEAATRVALFSFLIPCPFRKSCPRALVMQSGQDVNATRTPDCWTSAAQSSPASAADRVGATKQTCQRRRSMSVAGGRAENICS